MIFNDLIITWLRKAVLHNFQLLKQGHLIIREKDQTWHFGDTHAAPVTITIIDPRTYPEIALNGSIGAGEAYFRGWWETDQLTDVLALILKNREAHDHIDSGLSCLSKPLRALWHFSNRNSLTGSRRNIAAHYDLGNDFFALFLDPSMMYSSAIFPTPQSSLAEASLHKIKIIGEKLQLTPQDHILEIGSGWGGYAIYTAKTFGCRITTTTISQQQYALAKQRIAAAGLENQITLLLKDYRELDGQFDKIVSIEMLEAVGYAYYPTFFACCDKLLKPNGSMLLQTITIADQLYEKAKKSVDFIQRFIFPGSCIPSITALADSMTNASQLRIFNLDDIGAHYAHTLYLWRENFLQQRDKILAMGHTEEFIRMWLFYFCYCEAGFATRWIGDVQMLLKK